MANAKVATIPNEFSQDFEKVLKMLNEIGIKYIELASMWGKSILDLSEEEEDRVRSLMNDYGMQASAIQTQIMKCHPRNSPFAKIGSKNMHLDIEFNLSRIDRAIELADRFDTQNIVCYSYFNKAGITEENWQNLLEDYEFLVKKCEKADKILVLENEHDTYVALVDDIYRIMHHFGSKHLRHLFDTGNLFRRVDSFTREDYEKIGKYIGYWHVKDVKKKLFGKKSWAVLGTGIIPSKEIFSWYINDGFDGFFSAEPHQGGPKRWQLAKQHVINLKNLIQSL
ncbi:MAG: sugar phosphate isomerase/epimerase family protein [Promethearchaeota archaeon]